MMTTLSPDTHSEIERLQIERLRELPTWRKVTLMAEMGQAVRTMALADLLPGPELAERVYRRVPEEN